MECVTAWQYLWKWVWERGWREGREREREERLRITEREREREKRDLESQREWEAYAQLSVWYMSCYKVPKAYIYVTVLLPILVFKQTIPLTKEITLALNRTSPLLVVIGLMSAKCSVCAINLVLIQLVVPCYTVHLITCTCLCVCMLFVVNICVRECTSEWAILIVTNSLMLFTSL